MKLTKEEQLKIYRYLLGDFSLGAAYRSPLPDTVRSHKDRFSSFNVYETEHGNYRWKDHGDGGEHRGSALELLMTMKDLTFPEAVDYYNKNIKLSRFTTEKQLEKGIRSRRTLTREPVVYYTADYKRYELDWWMQYGITTGILMANRVYRCEGIEYGNSFLEKSKPTQPVFVYDLSEEGDMSSWKQYIPSMKKGVRSGWRSHNITPIPCEGFYRIDREAGHLIVASSTKDSMVLQKLGYNSMSVTGESAWRKILPHQVELNRLYDGNIYILFDGDVAGAKGSSAFSDVTGWFNIRLEYPPNTKDVAEIVRDYDYQILDHLLYHVKVNQS